MKIIVCGGRDFQDYEKVWSVLDDLHKEHPITEVIHGAAKGADLFAHIWAKRRNVPVVPVPAAWKIHKGSAGPRRNLQMLEMLPELVVAFQGGRGTAHMVQSAIKAGIQVITVQ